MERRVLLGKKADAASEVGDGASWRKEGGAGPPRQGWAFARPRFLGRWRCSQLQGVLKTRSGIHALVWETSELCR